MKTNSSSFSFWDMHTRCSVTHHTPNIAEALMRTQFSTPDIKKMYSQRLRFNKINNFPCFITDILKLGLF